MSTQDFDIVVIGAGMAGATAAAHLAAEQRVALIEAEDSAGYHTTGRSAAIWIRNYGPPDVQALTGASRDFYEQPPAGFSDHPLARRRAVINLAPPEQMPLLERLLAQGSGVRALPLAEAAALIPALRPGYAAGASIEEDAFDMDVAATHQGFLRQLRLAGGVLALRQRSGRIARAGGAWHVATTTGEVFAAPIVVNAAGAWGEEVGQQAGAIRVGLTPLRRTAAIIDPTPYDVADWPLVGDIGHTWYARPEARTRLMVSPADETPMPPHDVRPDELDVALGIDRMQQALAIAVRRIEHDWAGLRSFTADRSLAIGWDPLVEGFFWCVGQGGYGIQTAPAAGRLVADLIAGRAPALPAEVLEIINPRRFMVAATSTRGGGGA